MLLAVGPVFAADLKPHAEATFALHVLPVLKTKCFPCHGGDASKIKGGFNLTSRMKLLAGGESGGGGIVPGKAVQSPLYRAVLRTDPDFAAMPPKENDQLTEADRKSIREWIDGGAPGPRTAPSRRS